MDAFQALPVEAFSNRAELMWSNMRPINPHKSDAELRRFSDEQIALSSSAEWQRINRFSEPFVSERVSITVLSHAFAEALINAILVIGLASTKKRDLFALLEQASVKDKWTLGPQSFLPAYTFEKSGQLFNDLTALCKLRNSYTHSKLTLRDAADSVATPGAGDVSFSFARSERTRIRRFLELPYSLHRHVCERVVDSHLQFALERLVDMNPLRSRQMT
jgi:hypothetical protein